MGKASRRNRQCHGGAAYAKLLSVLPPSSVMELPYAHDGPHGPVAPKGPRQMADFVYRCFLYYKRDKTNVARYHLLRAYFGYLFVEEDNIWNEQDACALCKVGENRHDPPHVQVEAKFALAWMAHKRRYDMEGYVDCLEKIVEICKNATPEERDQSLVVWLQNSHSTVGHLLRARQQYAEEVIHKHYHELTVTQPTPDMKWTTVARAAGNCCDHCQTTREEVGAKAFLCCSICEFEYYCSEECQLAAWKAKHRKYCRAPGDFRPDDQALDVRNGLHILLIRPMATTTLAAQAEAWLVSDTRKEHERIVPTKALQRLRPALWRAVMTTKEVEQMQKDCQQKMEEVAKKQKEVDKELGNSMESLEAAQREKEELGKELEKAYEDQEKSREDLEKINKKVEELLQEREELLLEEQAIEDIKAEYRRERECCPGSCTIL